LGRSEELGRMVGRAAGLRGCRAHSAGKSGVLHQTPATRPRKTEKKKGGRKRKILTFLKKTQLNEFKYKFEFKQPKTMHQHEYNNKIL
jgi:hypothetical protein